MPSNLITGRVAEFLGSFSPFDLIDKTWLVKIAESIEILYLEDRNVIFKEGDPPGDRCFVVRKGRVNLLKNTEDDVLLVDVCGEGDMFGIRAMLSNEEYKLTAIVETEVLVYAIPVGLIRRLISENAVVGQFFAVGLASSQVVLGHKNEGISSKNRSNWKFIDFSDTFHLNIMQRELVLSSPDDSIDKVSDKMSRNSVGSSVIIDDKNIPLGIITDTDLRNQVATGKVPIHQPVKLIMSTPVITIKADQKKADIILKMMSSGVHHLCITEDGTPNTMVIGIISNHDLLLSQSSNPSIILRAINKVNSMEKLKNIFVDSEYLIRQYISNDVPAHFIQEVVSSIRDAIISKAITLTLASMPDLKEVDFCWVALGSEGRKEQILRTDIDNIIVFRGNSSEPSIKTNLLEMAEKINNFLVTCGFSQCPAGIMAHFPEMCLTEKEWMKKFGHWIHNPEPVSLMNTTIYFDLRAVFGKAALIEGIKQNIILNIKGQKSFLNYLAKNATENPPPLSFFNQFMVESSGEHKNEFDIKKRAIMPMVDAARLLTLENHYYESVSTIDRFRYLTQQEPQNKNLYEEAIIGYEFLLMERAKAGIQHKDEGRFIDISSSNKIEKKLYKEIFHIITELHKLIRVRFQLDFFR